MRGGLVSLIGKVAAKGPAGTVRELHPSRLAGRLEARLLRAELRRQLIRIWTAQEDHVEALRDEALRQLLSHARRSVPYYRELFDEAGVQEPRPEDLTRLPLLDKRIIRDNDLRLRCDGWQHRPHYHQATSGTTGQGLEFIVDNLAAVAVNAHQEFAFRLMGYRESERIAAFAGPAVPEDERRRDVYWVRRAGGAELPFGSVAYSSHYMSARTLPFYFDDLERGGFRFFMGYPSAVHALARYCLDSGRRFSRPIEAVQLTSEIVPDEQLAEIEAAFGARVFLQYGHAEASVYAHTVDGSREYLCSPLVGVAEVLDASGRQVEPGEEGEIVVTGLHSRVMPFLRYRTGDLAIYGGSRRGITVLRKVLGRTQEALLQRDGTKVSLTGLVFGQHMKAFARAERWQIVQEEPGRVTVCIVPRGEYRDEDGDEIVATFRRVGAIDATVRRVAELPRTAAGKHRFVVAPAP